MRTLLVILALIIYFIVTLPAYLILLLIGVFNPVAKARGSQFFVAWGFKFIIFFTGMKKIILGVENIPKDEAFLFVGNHRGFFEIPLVYSTVPVRLGFISKKEIKKVPFLSWWMMNMQCLFMDRKDIRAGLKTILQGIEQIKAGQSMYIAPEGTRNHGTELLPFKEGSFKLAEKSGCRIIPVAFSGTDDVFENHFPWIKKATVVIEYGKPVALSDLSEEQQKHIGAYMRDVITNMIAEHPKYIEAAANKKHHKK